MPRRHPPLVLGPSPRLPQQRRTHDGHVQPCPCLSVERDNHTPLTALVSQRTHLPAYARDGVFGDPLRIRLGPNPNRRNNHDQVGLVLLNLCEHQRLGRAATRPQVRQEQPPIRVLADVFHQRVRRLVSDADDCDLLDGLVRQQRVESTRSACLPHGPFVLPTPQRAHTHARLAVEQQLRGAAAAPHPLTQLTGRLHHLPRVSKDPRQRQQQGGGGGLWRHKSNLVCEVPLGRRKLRQRLTPRPRLLPDVPRGRDRAIRSLCGQVGGNDGDWAARLMLDAGGLSAVGAVADVRRDFLDALGRLVRHAVGGEKARVGRRGGGEAGGECC
mmetsp:Transcript_790/g.1667  ORF Transcript_790/g.1667 Transcript_790/m.1667 type:complete len:328 (-) Transcript_790:490-1473(-)